MADMEPNEKIHKAHVKETGYWREKIEYVEGESYSIMLLICETCHRIEAHCQHVKNSWNADGSKLTCDFCGIDGT